MAPFHAPVFIIGIAGGTGSGKTTAAKRIMANLPQDQASVIQHDWYYHDSSTLTPEERSLQNFDEPRSLDNELLAQHLQQLKTGHEVVCPQYDFTTHTRKSEQHLITPTRIIVVEGILIFAVEELRKHLDLRIFVDTDDDIRLMRRIKRDIRERGRSIEDIQRQYYDTVRPMHERHVAPSKHHAHLIVPEGGENRPALGVIIGMLLHVIATGDIHLAHL